MTPARRIFTALGGLTYRLGTLVAYAGMATDKDPYGVSADRALADVAAARDQLDELELALMAVKADREVASTLALAPSRRTA